MRRLLPIPCLVVVFVLFSSVSYAGTNMGLYSDVSASDCNIYDVPGLHEVHVVYTGATPIGATHFIVQQTHGASLSYLGDHVPNLDFLTIGSAEYGIGISLGGCYEAPVHVLTIHYYGEGTSSVCGRLSLGHDPRYPHPAPAPGQLPVSTCDFEIMWVDASGMHVNPTESCACEVAEGPTPTAVSTWGLIKSLYGTGGGAE